MAAIIIVLLMADLLFASDAVETACLLRRPKDSNSGFAFYKLERGQRTGVLLDGLTEELLNVLARNPKLQVTSRTSAFSFKGKEVDMKTIAEKLNVTHVLEGSVRKAGNQLRVTAQLIEVATDSHLWSQTYDRQMENIFAVQDEIANSVAGALKVALEGDSSRNSKQIPKLTTLTCRDDISWNGVIRKI